MISLEHKFIFLETPKTATTSICGELTELLDINLEIKLLKKSNHDTILNAHLGNLTRSNKKQWRDGHLSPHFYFKSFSNKGFLIFNIIRNPWDRFLSAFLHNYRDRQRKNIYEKSMFKKLSEWGSFEDFCFHLRDSSQIDPLFRSGHFISQSSFLNGNFKNIKFIDYNNLKNDIVNLFSNKLGLNFILKYHWNDSKKITPYRDYYTEETKSIVANLYKEDIENFNFKF
jgi:hypothetical protein